MGIRLNYGAEDRIKEIVIAAITLSDPAGLVQQLANQFNPEDLFDADELEEWAEDHRYVKGE